MADDLISGDMFEDNAGLNPDVVIKESVEANANAPVESLEQPRGADGKFAPKTEAVAEPAAAQPVTPVTAEKPRVDPEQFKGYLDERDKRQKLETQLEEANRKLQAAQQPARIPSVNDPDFVQFQQQELARVQTETRFDVSETMARDKHGDEPVTKAMDWAMQKAMQSPAFAAEYIKQKHPIDWAVKQQKRDIALGEVGDDLDAYKARIIAEYTAANGAPQPNAAQTAIPAAVTNQPTAVASQPASPAPPRSLAHANPAGGLNTQVAPGEFAAIDTLFNR